MKSLQEAVASKISEAGETVQKIVVDKLAQVEIHRRVDIITDALNLDSSLRKSLQKIDRPDIANYDTDGGKVEFFSQGRRTEIQKANEQIDRLTKAVETALEQNSADAYNKLSEIVKKGAGNQEKGQ